MQIYVTNNTLPGAKRSWWHAWNLNEPGEVWQRHDYRFDSLRVIEWWAAKMKGHELVCLDIEHVRPRPTPAELVRTVRAVRMFVGGTPVSLYGNHFGLPAADVLAKEYVMPTPRQADQIHRTASEWAAVYEACGTAFVDTYALTKTDETWIAPFVKKQAELCAKYLSGLPVIAWVSATWNGT